MLVVGVGVGLMGASFRLGFYTSVQSEEEEEEAEIGRYRGCEVCTL